MKTPLAGISLGLFRIWTYAFPTLLALTAIGSIALLIRLHKFEFLMIFQSINFAFFSAYFAFQIRSRNQVEVTPENVLVGLGKAILLCLVAILFIAATRKFWLGVPSFLYLTAVILTFCFAPLFELARKATFDWFKYKGIA
jgi:hypothetical protein